MRCNNDGCSSGTSDSRVVVVAEGIISRSRVVVIVVVVVVVVLKWL